MGGKGSIEICRMWERSKFQLWLSVFVSSVSFHPQGRAGACPRRAAGSYEFAGTNANTQRFTAGGDELPLQQRVHPINDPIHHAGRQAVDDYRACDGEDLRANAQDEPLCYCTDRTNEFFVNFVVGFRNCSNPPAYTKSQTAR